MTRVVLGILSRDCWILSLHMMRHLLETSSLSVLLLYGQD
jgi:hypothetical protein